MVNGPFDPCPLRLSHTKYTDGFAATDIREEFPLLLSCNCHLCSEFVLCFVHIL